MIFLLGELLFLVVLNDGLRCGVVDSKLLGNLSNNSCSYIDDTHSFLNVFQKFFAHLLPYLFVTLCCQTMLNKYWLYLIEKKLNPLCLE
jgi:hypothetical protein